MTAPVDDATTATATRKRPRAAAAKPVKRAGIEGQVLAAVELVAKVGRPATLNELARTFGTGAPMIASVARSLVDEGAVVPYYVLIHGVQTLFGLLPKVVE